MTHYDDKWMMLIEESRERVGGGTLMPFMDAGRILMNGRTTFLACVSVSCEAELLTGCVAGASTGR